MHSSPQVEEVLLQKGILLRGLAHPNLFHRWNAPSSDKGAKKGGKDAPGGEEGGGDVENTMRTLSNLYSTFGAVEVSPQNYFRYP